MKGKGSAVTKTVDVFIQPFGLRRRVEIGQTLYEVVREARIELTSICGGLGLCGKCRVIVTKGQETISKPTEAEQRHLLTQELSSEIRLACQVMNLARFLGRRQLHLFVLNVRYKLV